MSVRLQTTGLAAFQCLGDRCADTCCKGWGMQVDRATVARYERAASKLREAVVSGEAEFVMQRDAATGFCVKLDQGWCSIHRHWGDAFLGDACHFYPRAPRALGETMVVSAALSCPEIARLALYHDAPFGWEDFGDPRQPYLLNNYLPEGLTPEQALQLHAQLIALAGDDSTRVEHSLMRLSTIVRALEMQPHAQWVEALPVYLTLADGRIPKAESSPHDSVNLMHALHGLVQASTSANSARLRTVMERMADAIGVQFDGMTLLAAPDCNRRIAAVMERARAPWLQPLLRRYLQAQLSQSLFPFSGFGQTLSERITVIGVRFATVKLALATLDVADEAAVVDTIQPLCRALDHLADPALSLAMYRETGWVREARLRALLDDA